MKFKIISLFLSLISFSLFAQTSSDIKLVNKLSFYGIENYLFDSNLDSLLEITYIKNSFNGRKASSKKKAEFTDSIVSKKLKAIETYVDLSFNSQVNSFIKYYTHPDTRAKIEALLGLESQYSETFEEALKNAKLPLDLKYIPVSASALFPAAISQTGSSGIWQLSYPVAKRYELHITSYTDERRDVQKSTIAAVKYLKEMYNIYHDWNLAIGAYFCGAANVNKAISRANGERDYWKIYKFLPQYSREYLPSFIAMVYVSRYYKDYHILPLKVKMPKQIETLTMSEKIHFGQISEVLNISMQELKDLNPEYKRGIIQPVNDNNTLNLTAKYVESFKENEDSIYKYKATTFFQAPQTIVIAPTVVSSEGTNSEYFDITVPKNKAKLEYSVKSGDNLGLIAQWYNVSINEIKSWNNLYYKKTIYPGQKLNIYVPEYEVSKYKNLNTASYTQKQKTTSKTTTSSNTSNSNTSSSASKTSTTSSSNVLSSGFALTNDVKNMSSFVYYKVKSGDNLWDISRKFEGTSVEQIMKLNKLTGNYKLQVGQILKIKSK